MTDRVFGTPLWIAENQIPAVASALKDGQIEQVAQQLSAQALIERADLAQSHAGKSVSLWGREGADPVLAVADFPNGQLTVATKGAILLPFNDGKGEDITSALLTTDGQKFQFFGDAARNRIPNDPSFRTADSDLGHFATHMIGKPHKCSGLDGETPKAP